MRNPIVFILPALLCCITACHKNKLSSTTLSVDDTASIKDTLYNYTEALAGLRYWDGEIAHMTMDHKMVHDSTISDTFAIHVLTDTSFIFYDDTLHYSSQYSTSQYVYFQGLGTKTDGSYLRSDHLEYFPNNDSIAFSAEEATNIYTGVSIHTR